MMRRPWVVGVEVPGEGIGEGRHGRAAGVVSLEWWGAPGRRHAVRTVIKAMMAQLRPPVLLVLPGSHGQGAVAIGPVGSHWVVAHVAAGLQQGEATRQVGGHCMVARGVNRHENRGSQQHHRKAMMGRLCVACG